MLAPSAFEDEMARYAASVVFGVLTSIVASFAFALLVDAILPTNEPKP
jgi:hypothetical protein